MTLITSRTPKHANIPSKVKGSIRCHKCQLKCRDAEHYLSHKCELASVLALPHDGFPQASKPVSGEGSPGNRPTTLI